MDILEKSGLRAETLHLIVVQEHSAGWFADWAGRLFNIDADRFVLRCKSCNDAARAGSMRDAAAYPFRPEWLVVVALTDFFASHPHIRKETMRAKSACRKFPLARNAGGGNGLPFGGRQIIEGTEAGRGSKEKRSRGQGLSNILKVAHTLESQDTDFADKHAANFSVDQNLPEICLEEGIGFQPLGNQFHGTARRDRLEKLSAQNFC